jgi:hypothetical protein
MRCILEDDNVFYTVQILTTRWVTILRCTYETRSALSYTTAMIHAFEAVGQ